MRQLVLPLGRMLLRQQRTSNQVALKFKTVPLTVQKRFSGGYIGYRELNYDPTRPFTTYLAEFLAGIMFWWIGWNLMTDWRHLIGEFIWPQRSEWTDEELGIPPE